MPEDFLNNKLNERKELNAFRTLRLPDGKIDFCSNDYLGLARVSGHSRWPDNLHGSTGSRLLAGNYPLIEETEKLIAAFHQSPSALIFNSGYDANIGLLSCVPQKGDAVIYDYLCHASIRDGIRLSFAQSFSFAHNDLEDLGKKLKHACGDTGMNNNIFVVTESVFSMDGDEAPLNEIVQLCEKYNAHLIVDEAHATGVVGTKGEGLVQHLQLHQKVFARVHTFGKALGCHGAVVLGSETLRNYLINFARSFIYSTALPETSVAAIKNSYESFPLMDDERKKLQKLIHQFQHFKLRYRIYKSNTPIQIVEVPGNTEVKAVADLLQQSNLDVRPILYPTVPKGSERLRIVLHSFNTDEELSKLCGLLS
jgi:8-amino-7-oxononanoate synthase